MADGITGGTNIKSKKTFFTFTKQGAVPLQHHDPQSCHKAKSLNDTKFPNVVDEEAVELLCANKIQKHDGYKKDNDRENKREWIRNEPIQSLHISRCNGPQENMEETEDSPPESLPTTNTLPDQPETVTEISREMSIIVQSDEVSMEEESSQVKGVEGPCVPESLPCLEEVAQVYDEGYHSSSGKTSPCLDREEINNVEASHYGELEETFCFSADNILDIDGVEFELVPFDSQDFQDGYISMAVDEGLPSIRSCEDLGAENLELKSVGTLKYSKKKKVYQEQTSLKSKRGCKRLSKEKLQGTWDHVVRCRDYRIKKKEKEWQEMSELEEMEARNKQLLEEEKNMTMKVNKLKAAYLTMITDGTIVYRKL